VSDASDVPGERRPYDAADPQRVRKREQRQAREAREDRELLIGLFKLPAGRRFLWSILKRLGALNVTFAASPGGVPDNFATFYAMGSRDAGLGLYHEWMAADRDGMWALLDELDPRFGAKTNRDDD